jgi:hypothetical protein
MSHPTQLRAIFAAAFAVAPMGFGCAQSEEAAGCDPGSVSTCPGPGECSGIRSCRSDGSGYGPCQCGTELLAVPEDGDCLSAGEVGCGLSNRCCAGSTCVPTENARGQETSICAAECRSRRDCESGCCSAFDGRVSVCAPRADCSLAGPCAEASDCITGCCVGATCVSSQRCAPVASSMALFGADGAFLGVLSSSRLVAPGVCNPAGAYGSSTSPTSIFNPTGTYGSATSPLSAYNPSTLTPPVVVDETIGSASLQVTKNPAFQNAVDPDDLCDFLAQIGL